jgi:hypothetical protein
MATYPPSPWVFWNHRVGDKTRNSLLESVVYGYNFVTKGLRGSLEMEVLWNQQMLWLTRAR